MSRVTLFKNTKQRINKKRRFGFDIETHNDNKDFTCASIVGIDRYKNSYCKIFKTKDELITELKTNVVFRGSIIFATQLSFDFLGTFFNTEDESKFHLITRQTKFLHTKTYFEGNEFFYSPKRKSSRKSRKSLEFYDTLNFAKMSVDQMGHHLGIPKLDHPMMVYWEHQEDVLGKYPNTQEEMDYLEEYNIRDSEITYKFMEFFIKELEEAGGSFRITIASCAMSLFKNKYLGDFKYYQKDKETLREELQSYYGGRVEAFKRGPFHNAFYYDINSLYPSVMRDFEYPDPNSQHISNEDTTYYLKYMGSSTVEVTCPKMHKPYLPYKVEGDFKLIFPTGTFKGTYTHADLNYAISLGYIINKVFKSIYYTQSCSPFKDYMNDVYGKRMFYKNKDDPTEIIYKSLMNNLYGKFGEKFDGVDSQIHKDNMTKTDFEKEHLQYGDYYQISENIDPKSHCIPIWASYVTSYARIRHYPYLCSQNVLYCDTDSVITSDVLETSKELGKWKKEMDIQDGFIVRPKFYGLSNDEKEDVKIKGLPLAISFKRLCGITCDEKFEFKEFASMKQAIQRNITPNQIIDASKRFILDDDKRVWPGLFDNNTLQESEPIHIGEQEDYEVDDATQEMLDIYKVIESQI